MPLYIFGIRFLNCISEFQVIYCRLQKASSLLDIFAATMGLLHCPCWLQCCRRNKPRAIQVLKHVLAYSFRGGIGRSTTRELWAGVANNVPNQPPPHMWTDRKGGGNNLVDTRDVSGTRKYPSEDKCKRDNR